MKKKMLAMTVAMTSAVAITGCGGDDGASTSTNEGGQEVEKIVYSYATFNNEPTSETLDSIEAEINKITVDKIGVEVELMPISIANYSSQVSLSFAGGDEIDVFQSLGNFNVCVNGDMAYDLTDLMDEYAPGTKALLGEELLNACVKDGSLYGIPTYKPYALTPMVIYKQEIADELGIDMSQVQNLDDLTEVLREVKAAYPNMSPLVPSNTGVSGVHWEIENVDYLTDDFYTPKGVMVNDDFVVQDYYSLPEFKEVCDVARTWYNEGLILKDAATTASSATELMNSEISFCYLAAYSYPEEDTAASLNAMMPNSKIGAVQIGDAYLDTTAINALSWMVSSTSKHPEAALKFLDLTFTDPDIANLLIYGIEDRDYVLDSEGYMSYPEGKDAGSVPYTAQLSCGTLGNFFNMYPMAGTKKESLVWEEEQNKLAKKSVAMGFTFDSNNVKTEYTAVSNVINTYLPGLVCGALDPETVIPEFTKELEKAGLGTIITEKQTQLDAWKEAN